MNEAGFPILNFVGKRPNNSYPLLKGELINYVKNQIKKNKFPSRRELESKFRVRMGGLFDGVEDLYSQAGSPYIQKNSQEIKSKKAELLSEIAKNVLPQLNLKLLKARGPHERGIDILAEDKGKNLVGVELKAYNKYEMVKRRNIEQLKRLIIKEKLNRCLLITTTSKIQSNMIIPATIEIIDYNKLKELCSSIESESLEFIRTYSAHRETYERREKRSRIIKYVREKAKRGEDISHRDILRDTRLSVFTYFKDIYEVYKIAGIRIPINKLKVFRSSTKRYQKRHRKEREKFIKKLLTFISNEVKKGKYPSGINIGNKFGISHIWNYVKVSDLYKKLGLKPYHERSPRFL